MTSTNPFPRARPVAPTQGRSRACAAWRPRTPAGTRGFSLLELLTVLSILVVVAAIAAPRFSQSGINYRLDGAARQVLADLGQAQAAARAASTSRTLVFTEASRSYSIAALQALDGTATTYAVSLASDPYRIDSIKADFAGRTTFDFDGFGQPSSSGTITLALRGRTRTITVAAGTGGLALDGVPTNGGAIKIAGPPGGPAVE